MRDGSWYEISSIQSRSSFLTPEAVFRDSNRWAFCTFVTSLRLHRGMAQSHDNEPSISSILKLRGGAVRAVSSGLRVLRSYRTVHSSDRKTLLGRVGTGRD